MSDLGYTVSQLDTAIRRLRQQWSTTRAVWDDAAARQFEQSFWTQVDHESAVALAALERLAQIVAQAERACP